MRRGSDSSSEPNRLPAPASSSSSPTTDECRVFANLSPLEKAEPYIQRFSRTNYPSRRQLFTPPQQQTTFKEANSNVDGDSDNHIDVLQIPSPSERVQECLADSTNSMTGTAVPTETIIQPDDGNAQPHKMDETTRTVERSDELSDLTRKDLNNVCVGTISAPQGNEGSYSIILNGVEYDVANFDASSNTYIDVRSHSNKLPSECKKIVDGSEDHNISSRPVSNQNAMDTNKNQCGMDRNLQSETANDSRSIVRYTSENPTYKYNCAGLRLFSDAKQKGLCSYALPISSCEENIPVAESSSRFEDLNQMSPKRKRKRATLTSESDGCKVCNCKRSKCLKLYCECFAAGIYCLDTCACVNCYNKLEYEDTVFDARQQIESRNPHAFAPKVVKHAMESPRNVIEDRDRTARHKRGCNCKKSKCRKKYCECYQSKVGCSDGCRCDNCQNSFGTRKETTYERVERWNNESHEKMKTGQANTDSIKATGGAQACQELGNTSNSAPPSNLWNYTQSQLGNRVQSDGSFHWQYPPHTSTHQLDKSEVLHDYSADEGHYEG